MAKSRMEELNEILQITEVDVGNNTLFAKANKVPVSKDHLTLVICSGGSGASAIREAIKSANQKLETDFSQYMKFIMVDSATNELSGIEKELGKDTLRILNISVDGAKERLEYSYRPDFYRNFVPRQYDTNKLNGHGSGKDRMTGKIKFYDDAPGGTYNDVKFRQMIASLYQGNGDWATKKNLPVDIMVLAGLSGGNGSGTFLELAAHARQACKDAGATGAIRVFGYLFLPDTVEQFEDNVDVQSRLHVNGYAALKELESYMNIPFSPEREEIFSSRDNVTKIHVTDRSGVFDYPTLISGDYEETKSMMAESIINLAVDNNGTFDQNSFYSNGAVMRSDYLLSPQRLNGGLLREDVFPEDSHRYNGIGYAYAAIPEKIVTSNIVSNVCKKLYEPDPLQPGKDIQFCTAEKRMSKTDMEEQIRLLFNFSDKTNITDKTFWEQKILGELSRVSTLSQNQNEITREEINSGNTKSYELGYGAEKRQIEGKKEMKTHLVKIFDTFKENAEKVMKNYGPRAMEYLYTGKGPDDKDGNPQYYTDISIMKQLEYARGQLNEIVTNSTKAARPAMEIKNGLAEFIFKKKINEWKSAFHSAVQFETKQAIASSMIEMEGSWDTILKVPMLEYKEQCSAFAERIEILTNVYRSAGSPLDEISYTAFMQKSQSDNCVSLCTNGNVYDWIKEQVGRKISSVSLTDVKNDLIESFTADPLAWTSNETGKTRRTFDDVMSKCCALGNGARGNVGISLTATSYFEYVLNQVEPSQVSNVADQLVKGIVGQLLEKSKPAIKSANSDNIVNRFVMLPQSLNASAYGKTIVAAFTNEINNGLGSGNAAVAISPSVSDVVCYQTSVANAICDMMDISKWEQRYNEKDFENPDNVSIHLSNGEYGTSYVEKTKSQVVAEQAGKENRKPPVLVLSNQEEIIFGTGLSWEHYPSLDLKHINENKKEQQFLNTIFEPIVNYALKEGIIERKMGSSPDSYLYVINTLPEEWTDLNVDGYESIGNDGRFERGSALFEYIRQLNPLSTVGYQKEIVLAGSGHFAGAFDFSSAKSFGSGMSEAVVNKISIQYMKRILRRNTYLFLKLRETLCRYYEVVRVLEEREKDMIYKNLMKKFYTYYQYGVIKEDNNKWYKFMNLNGMRSVFCKFDDIDRLNYTEFENKLIDKGWEILIAFKKFSAFKKEELEQLAELQRERLMDMTQQEVDQMKAANKVIFENYRQKIQDSFMKKISERTVQGVIEKELGLSKGAESFYVNAIISLYELEAADLISEPIPVTMAEPVSMPKEVWDCTCGYKGIASKFCPECGNKKPEPEPVPVQKDVWDCTCGYKGIASKYCPECGKKKPEPEPVPVRKDVWDCTCGYKGIASKFCPECGNKKC